MNMPLASVSKNSTHPMLIAASTAVVLLCLTGTAAVLGWIPMSNGASLSADGAVTVSSTTPVADKVLAQRVPAPVVYRAPRAEPARRAPALVCQNCGVVESVRTVTTRGDGSGLGAAGGAVVGGLLGNQVGGGHGKEAMTVVGAIGGAFAGNQIEKHAKSTRSYETTVRMDNGSSRTVAQAGQPVWHGGDHVKIVDGVVRMKG